MKPFFFAPVSKSTSGVSEWWNFSGTPKVWSLASRVNHVQKQVVHSRTGVNTPNYWKLNRSQLPVHGASMVKTVTMPWWGTISNLTSRKYTGGFGKSSGLWVIPNLVLPSISTEELAALRRSRDMKLLLKIKDQKSNLVQALAERRQTANLFAKTAMRIVGAARALRKGNFKQAAKALGVAPRKRGMRRFNAQYMKDQSRALGSGWLELQYGWKPLLTDVYGSAEQIAKGHVQRQVTRSSVKVVVNRKEKNAIKTGTSYTFLETTIETTYKKGVEFHVPETALKTLTELGITNPVLIAWELMPYSFIIDWFIPIGNYISAWDATLGLEFKQGYETVFTKSTVDGIFLPTGWQGFLEGSITQVKFDRVTLPGFPTVPPPQFKNPISKGHIANAIALLSQSFKR